ncbi:transglycosylase SLT domain-containing protein [Quisquiliibacterium transsilvanicum]|uniref:Transglycosylase SLT domain-containing protein n=1 Tax=Quisquiliibacterium transsilvanicum TaxID=1549638 RepID=A0A7W8HDM9_9BURK|nr:hypothetical protein [Quisquiliibacterium transsilvanicum]
MTFRRAAPIARSLRIAPVALLLLGATALAQAAGSPPRVGESPAHAAPSSAKAAQLAAQATPSPAQLIEQGTRLEHGESVPRDLAAAHDLYCKAARSDSPDAFLRLGWMYANGRGVERDDSIASTLFRRAADAGSAVGARLSEAIRGSEDRLPECLTKAAQVAQADRGPTPTVSDPAQFRAPRGGIEQQALVAAVVRMAREFRLDPRLVFALIRVESGFDPMARSVKNAQGLMQLIPETAERFAVRNVFDPLENLRGGMSYLRWLLSYFEGDVVLTLAAYNAGEGAVNRHGGVPPYPETLAYVQRIRAFYPFDQHAFDPKVARNGPPRILPARIPGPRTEAPFTIAKAG